MRLTGLVLLLLIPLGVAAAQSTNFPIGPQYLITTDSTLFLRPIATPSLSLGEAPASTTGSTRTGAATSNYSYAPNPELQHQANLFPIYYGYPRTEEVELSSTEPSRQLPASIDNIGFANVPNAQSLRQLGYGVTIAEAAALSKARKRSGTHVYTNEDIQRMHSK